MRNQWSTPDPEARAERLARIRAQRGTPERAQVIEQLLAQKAAAKAAFDAAVKDERAWCRKFDRADLRTQALMLADVIGEPVAGLLHQLAETMPPGIR